MPAAVRILVGVSLMLAVSCSRSTGPDGERYPVEGVIEASLSNSVGPSDTIGFAPDPQEGLTLRLVSRKQYEAGCYRFWTTSSSTAQTIRVEVKAVYRPDALCTAELAPAQSWLYLGNPDNGAYSLHLADPERVYVGLIEINGFGVKVTFPDTTRFNFNTSIYR